MPDRETNPGDQALQESAAADTRDKQTFPFELRWEISSTEQQAIAHIAQFDALIETGIADSWLTDDDIFALKLCFNEGLVNASKHGNKYDEDRRVLVEIQMDNQKFEVSIKDDSPVEFRPEDVPDPTMKENLLKTGGRGTFLTDRFFGIGKNAKFEFFNPGNKVTLTRYRNPEEISL